MSVCSRDEKQGIYECDLWPFQYANVPTTKRGCKEKLTITFHIFLFFFGLVLVDVNIDDIDPVLGYRGLGILIAHDVNWLL